LHAAPIRDPQDAGPRTLERLAASYIEDHLSGLSVRFREKQNYLLDRWVLPRLGARTVTAWTPADSAAVIAAVRRAGASDALVQDVGTVMRALVTHARRLRWLTAQSENPMSMVRYAKAASIQGAASVYVPRSSLPTDEQCAALFQAMEGLGHRRLAIAMRLCHRAGLRWGELIALQPHDIQFQPARIVHVRRAVEQPRRGPARLKAPENGKIRTSIFPKSLTDDLADLVEDTLGRDGPEGLLLPSASGRIMRRSNFQQIWIRAADGAGWPMTAPLQRTAGYGQANKGRRWTGAAKWSPQDLRHVAACWMLFDLGLDPAVVAGKLGHADPNFTIRRYIGVRGHLPGQPMTSHRARGDARPGVGGAPLPGPARRPRRAVHPRATPQPILGWARAQSGHTRALRSAAPRASGTDVAGCAATPQVAGGFAIAEAFEPREPHLSTVMLYPGQRRSWNAL
jgi:integrase